MIHIMILAAVVLPFCMMGTEQTFQLDFNNNNVKPAIAKGGGGIGKALNIDPAVNFPEGFVKKGFRNSGKDCLELHYSAVGNVTFPRGTASFWCKTPNPKIGKNQRLMHIYSPKAGANSVLIYTFYLAANGDFIVRNELSETQERTSAKINVSEIEANKFFKVDVTWDGKLLSIYKDGELQEDADFPETYAKEAALPRGWSALHILRSFKELNDDPASGVIIDEIKFFDDAKDSDAIRADYEADLKKVKE